MGEDECREINLDIFRRRYARRLLMRTAGRGEQQYCCKQMAHDRIPPLLQLTAQTKLRRSR